VLLPSDPLLGYASGRPLDPVNLSRSAQLQYLVETGTEYAGGWRQKFSKLSLRAWDQGGAVLVTNHVLAPRPERDWNWTEGDIPEVRWADFPAFFSRLELSRTPDRDGFSEVARTGENRRAMEDVAVGAARRSTPSN